MLAQEGLEYPRNCSIRRISKGHLHSSFFTHKAGEFSDCSWFFFSLGGEILDAEMSEDADHNLTPALDSISYRIQNRTGSENSLLDDDDDDYFLNSGDLAGIPVVGSDNEDDQNFTAKDTLSSVIHDEDHLEEGKRVTEHELDSEKEIQIQNAIQKDLTSPFEQGPVFKSIRKDFSITRDNGKETFSAKDKNREGHFQEREKRLEKIPKDMDSRLKSSFLDKAGNC